MLPVTSGLVALQAPAALDPKADLPSRILMLKWGENDTAQGPVKVGEKTLAASRLWSGLGFGDVVIDFNHNTVPGHPSYRGEPAMIGARQATLSVVPNVGLVFDNIQWTDEGRKFREHYPDLSPTVKLDDDGEVIFCHSGALCRNGATKDLHLFSAESTTQICGETTLADKLLTLDAELFTTLSAMATKEKKEPAYAPKTATVHKPGTYMLNTDLLKSILKLPADATDDDVNSALEAFGKAGDEATDPNAGTDTTTPASAGADTGDMKALSASLKTFTASLSKFEVAAKKVTELETKFTTLTASMEASERQAIVDAAEAQGKQVPTEWLPDKDGKGGLPNTQLRTLCATLPEIIPLSARTPRVVKLATAGNADGLTSTEREVMRNMGLEETTWKKHNAA